MNKGGFSWKRFLGLSASKARVSRKIGIPFTKGGKTAQSGGWGIASLVIYNVF